MMPRRLKQKRLNSYRFPRPVSHEKRGWKALALESEPNLTENQIRILSSGPKSLSESWFLQAMRYKYGDKV